MSSEPVSSSISRYERAQEIISDFERQHNFKLPAPWVVAAKKLLLAGIKDHDLHLIFQTMMQVEFEAGRLAERPVDYTGL